MIIETKYDVGQKVFAIYFVPETNPKYRYGVDVGWVTRANVCITQNNAAFEYELKVSTGPMTRDESWIFPTQEAAQAECDRRNGAT